MRNDAFRARDSDLSSEEDEEPDLGTIQETLQIVRDDLEMVHEGLEMVNKGLKLRHVSSHPQDSNPIRQEGTEPHPPRLSEIHAPANSEPCNGEQHAPDLETADQKHKTI